MEERKLIRLGNSSFAISLPKEWISKSGLNKGDKVFVEENGNGEIIVAPDFKKNSMDKEILIAVNSEDEEVLRKEFTSAYIIGADVIKFEGKITRGIKKSIEQIIERFLSCEVIKEDGRKIVIKDFFNLENLDLDNFIRKIEYNIRDMFDIIILGIKTKKITKSNIKEIKKIDLDINKFYFLFSRILIIGMNNPSLINKLKTNYIDLFNKWWLVFHLENTGDLLKTIVKDIPLNHISQEFKKRLLPIIIKLKNRYLIILKNFYSQDKEKLLELIKEGKTMMSLCENLTKNKNPVISLLGGNLKSIDKNSYQILKMISNLSR